MKYFLINGYLPSHQNDSQWFSFENDLQNESRFKYYENLNLEIPESGLFRIASFKNLGSLYRFVYDSDNTAFMISSTSQRKAYLIGNSLRSIFGIFHGYVRDDNRLFEFLVELTCKPHGEMNIDEIVEHYKPLDDYPVDKSLLSCELQSGVFLFNSQLTWSINFMKYILLNPNLRDAVVHLEQSYRLVYGFMTGSYYYSHYIHDRKAESRCLREKKYFEWRTRFDLAFLSTFRSIEALLGKANIKRHEIEKLLSEVDNLYKTNFLHSRYHSYYEIFSGDRKERSYKNMVLHYLDIRNSVAAHGNIKPPTIITSDQLYEIQLFTRTMIHDVVSALSGDKGLI